ncbi:hypothetical protein M1N23_02110 [Dehalococcoidia bacterium]|nr:hypothetical protein [Dehalococcoidia bacterium]
MTQPLSQTGKPNADRYGGKRKLFLVPNYAFPPNIPDDGLEVIQRYWSEVRDAVGNLERTLGQVTRVYHEMLFGEGADGMKLLEALNPQGHGFIQAMISAGASLISTEERELVEEHADWQRVLSIGPISEKVMTTAIDGFQNTLQARYDKITERIQENLEEGESGVLFIRDDHSVQFPADIQVFYVAPPALDTLKKWIADKMNTQVQASQVDEKREDHESTAQEIGDTGQ